MPSRRPLMLAPLAAFSLLAAGCGGGGSGSAGVANVTTSTTSAAAATQNGALAFARCMRSHGLPGWPDPTSDGGFDKSKLRQLGYSVARVRAVEDGPCNHLLGALLPGADDHPCRSGRLPQGRRVHALARVP